MKALLTVVIAGVLLGGVFANSAEAGDGRGKNRRVDARHYRDYDNDDYRRYRGNRYVRQRDIVVVRDYYQPYYRPVPRAVRAHYYRGGYLPVGWRTRVVPVPVYYPDVKEILATQGADATSGTPQQFVDWVKQETALYGRIIKGANIRIEQ